MFGFLSEKIGNLYKSLRSSRLSAQDLDRVFQDIETYLLEADAPVITVRSFIESARTDLLGNKYPSHLNAQQAVIKVLHEKLTTILGGDTFSLQFKHQPTKILVAGLQGTGKTTSVIKLAAWLKQQKKKVLVVSFDIHRPAARQQTEMLAKKAGVDTTGFQCEATISAILQETIRASRYYDVLVIDTAGRSEIDAGMMAELTQITQALDPQEKLYVLDAMAGQSALAVAKVFHETIACTGAIVTKLDSDARGGAILGLKATLGIPILFLSLGEHVDQKGQWTIFHPERIAQRILGLGDMLSLIEKIEGTLSDRQKKDMEATLHSQKEMNFDDLLGQLMTMNDMAQQQGGLKGLLQHIPGINSMAQGLSSDQLGAPLKKAQALIHSMTPKERKSPYLLEQGGRKKRIALGSGMTIGDLNGLIRQLKQFDQMNKMMKNPSKMKEMMRNMPQGMQNMMKQGPGA